MGSLVAARLARGGADVTVAGTWRDGLDTIARRGITVEDESGAWSARVATASVASAGQADFVLVMVKSASTADVAPRAARALAPGGMIVTLQNGLGNREALAEAAGPDRVAVAVTTLGATLLGPGRVRGFPGRIDIGAAAPAPVAGLVQALRAGGIETETTADIARLVWRKLAVSCSVNPVSALLGVANGLLLASAASRERVAAGTREVGAVAAAKGIDLGADPAELAFDVAARTAGNRSSMLQDLERGATTEIDALCGAVVSEAAALGVPTPVNAALWREVREREGRPLAAPAGAGMTMAGRG
jgi:2-dehydropantoate 2-reductase